MLRQQGVPTDGETAEERATKDGQEVADVQRHDGQHAIDDVSDGASDRERRAKAEKSKGGTYSRYPTPAMTVSIAALMGSTLARHGLTPV